MGAVLRPLGLTALAIIAVDQIIKYWVLVRLDLDVIGRHEVAPPYLVFQMAWNRGINFGLFDSDGDGARWVLIGIALAICVGLLIWAARARDGLVSVAVGLIVGGALGNVIDRVLYGAVADFINMSCCGISNPFSFNVADAAIFAGAVVLVFLPSDKAGGKPRGA